MLLCHFVENSSTNWTCSFWHNFFSKVCSTLYVPISCTHTTNFIQIFISTAMERSEKSSNRAMKLNLSVSICMYKNRGKEQLKYFQNSLFLRMKKNVEIQSMMILDILWFQDYRPQVLLKNNFFRWE